MLIVDPEKRYSLQQVKMHKWTRAQPVLPVSSSTGLTLSPTSSCPSLLETLGGLSVHGVANEGSAVLKYPATCLSTMARDNEGCDDDEDYDFTLIEWICNELTLEQSSPVLESVTAGRFDHFYAMYHLLRDYSPKGVTTPCTSAPPSPPLLPVVAAGASQRKSSITTGIVERDSTPTTTSPNSRTTSPATTGATLNVQAASQRRHTFGPDGSAAPDQSTSQTMLTPPLLFLTPPTTGAPGPSHTHNLTKAPPNYPITNMDLLKPPNVLLMVNNNMARRASDGQANYNSISGPSSGCNDPTLEAMSAAQPVTCASTTVISSAQYQQQQLLFGNLTLQQLHQQFLNATSGEHSSASTPSPPAGFGNTPPLPTGITPSPPYSYTPPPVNSTSATERNAQYSRKKRHSLTESSEVRSRRGTITSVCSSVDR